MHTYTKEHSPIEGQYWVRAGWLIDGLGGPLQKDMLLGISAGRITRIETFRRDHGRGAVKDLSGATLLPVLVDAHVHLALSGTRDPEQRARQLAPTYEQACTAIATHVDRCAQCGILAVRDGGDRFGHVFDYRKSAPKANCRHIHISATCWAWHARGRYGRMIGRSPGQGFGLVEALTLRANGMDHLKLIHSGLNSLDHFGRQGTPQFAFEELKAAVAHSHGQGIPVMVHANGVEAVEQAIRAGCDSIEHGYFMGPDNLARLAEAQVAWVPTVIPMDALARDDSLSTGQRDTARRTRDHQLDQIRKAYQLGIPIVLGTDAGSIGVDHAVALADEMALLEQAGLSVEQVVHGASGRAARLLGLKNGNVIAPGRPASFIVVNGRPQELTAGLKKIDGLCVDGVWCQSI